MRLNPERDSATESPLSLRIVERLATETGISPMELTPLYESINPDALDTLFTTGGRPEQEASHVQFFHEGYSITVTADEEITITEGRE